MTDREHDGFDEFELPEEAAGGHVGHHDATAQGFGGVHDFEFEDAPEPPGMHDAPVGAGHDHLHDHGGGFSDIEPEDGHHDGVHSGVYPDEPVDGYPAEEHADVPVRPNKSLASKAVLPLGMGAVLALVGVGVWHSGVLGGSAPHAPLYQSLNGHAPVGPHLPAPGPRLPPTSGPVNAPPPSMPSLPPSVGPGVGGVANAPGMSSHDTLSPGTDAVGSPHPAGMSHAADLDSAIAALAQATAALEKTVDTRFDAVDQHVASTTDAIETHLDKSDVKLDEMNGHLNTVETRIDAFEKRLDALDGGAAHTRLPDTQPTSFVPRSSQAVPHARVRTSRASATHRGVQGYALRGVSSGASKTSAWVQTPAGFVLVKVGETISGVGTVKQIRPVGSSWEVVTTGGDIRP